MTELALRAELAHAPVKEGEADSLLLRRSERWLLQLRRSLRRLLPSLLQLLRQQQRLGACQLLLQRGKRR